MLLSLPLFFSNVSAITEYYTLSLHDALPILASLRLTLVLYRSPPTSPFHPRVASKPQVLRFRSEEHTSELQSHSDIVCRLLLEKKNTFVEISRFGEVGRETYKWFVFIEQQFF